jgi:hypothetical protein
VIAFQALADLVSACDIDELAVDILSLAVRALALDLPCLPDGRFKADVCGAAEGVLCAAIKAGHPAVTDYIPVFSDFARSNSQKRIASMGVHLLGLVVNYCQAAIDPSVYVDILSAAFAEAEAGGYIGFNCLKFVIARSPAAAAPHFVRIDRLLRAAITSVPRDRRSRLIADNALTAFWQFETTFSPEVDNNLLIRLLSLMPPEIDSEEIGEAMEFWDWLFDRAHAQPLGAFAAVLVRLLAQGIEELQAAGLTGESIHRYAGALAGMIGESERETFSLEVLGGDRAKAAIVLEILAEIV